MMLADAGPLLAAADARQAHHRACAALLRDAEGPIIVPQLAVTEVAYLLGDRLGAHAETAFARSLAAGELEVEPVTGPDWSRIAELCARYEDLPLGIVDASIVATAERLGVTQIATLDHRHFAVVRPAHTEAFSLLPV